MAKLTVSPALVAAILPFARIIVEGSGKLWDASRDAYIAAKAEFPNASDAAKAVSVVITDKLNGNPGSARAYLSTLVWLDKAGHEIAGISMGQATDIRYPKAPKPGDDGYVEHVAAEAAKRDEAAKKAKAEKEGNGDPVRGGYLQQIAKAFAQLDNSQLALVAAEVLNMVEAITAESELSEEELEAATAPQPEAIAA